MRIFQEKKSQNFSTLHHLPSEYDISTIVAPNQTRPGSLETRHLVLSMHIKYEENKARKGLRTATRKLGQKSKKDKKRSNEMAKNGRLALVYQDTLMLAAP